MIKRIFNVTFFVLGLAYAVQGIVHTRPMYLLLSAIFLFSAKMTETKESTKLQKKIKKSKRFK